MIKASGICKAYGPVQALRNVSFQVDAGEIVGLLGPNGAGKTTLMKVLTGYLQPDEGRVTIDDLDVLTDTLAVQRRIGYLPENAPLYPEMSVQAHLKMMADLRLIPASEKPALLSSAVRATALEGYLTRPIGQLSKGFRQRVGLAQTILHNPMLLILDEPTAGLDPIQIVEVRHLIRRLAQRSTILLSTHILSEVEAVCDRVIILINGEVRADARLSELSSQTAVILVLEPGASDATEELWALNGVRGVESHQTSDGWEYRITGDDQEDLRPGVFALARQSNWPLQELRREVRTLEMVFNELVSQADEQVNPPVLVDEQ
ncbi:MAG: ATP-binding cassette domain-containing protein [Chloroflexi bacterium]|nr:ATP-binding cassette domain-containing protein [Chloroflexota bacterium]